MTAEQHLADSLAGLAKAMRTWPATPATAGWKYRSFPELVLAEGRLFTPSPTQAVPVEWRAAPSTCYVSATLWATQSEIAYVEGWASTDLLYFGTEHAWCAKPGESAALDPTWDEPGQAYLGVAFHPTWRRRYAVPSLFTVEHEVGRNLLQHGLPDEARIDVGQPLPDHG
ncbi:hypothetical protein HDA40_002153 [Hamadaea flava]|uniref:RES domain-containing protein n=1 Tax=Hamadaea flava TaxID=1742688 RepID=A0ABV8LK52_9ACTN|nr:hypothetical protein [Hamadaea flava]MCP2323646.1 hypothetical protein [Hamadaea flava]